MEISHTLLIVISVLISLSHGDETPDEKLVKFHPITAQQYEQILSLTDGKPEITEGRLITSGVAALSGLATGLLPQFLSSFANVEVNKSTPTTSRDHYRRDYPLCVINTSDDQDDHDHDHDHGHHHHHRDYDDDHHYRDYRSIQLVTNSDNGHDHHRHRRYRKRPRRIVNCIVVVRKKDEDLDDIIDNPHRPPHRPPYRPPQRPDWPDRPNRPDWLDRPVRPDWPDRPWRPEEFNPNRAAAYTGYGYPWPDYSGDGYSPPAPPPLLQSSSSSESLSSAAGYPGSNYYNNPWYWYYLYYYYFGYPYYRKDNENSANNRPEDIWQDVDEIKKSLPRQFVEKQIQMQIMHGTKPKSGRRKMAKSRPTGFIKPKSTRDEISSYSNVFYHDQNIYQPSIYPQQTYKNTYPKVSYTNALPFPAPVYVMKQPVDDVKNDGDGVHAAPAAAVAPAADMSSNIDSEEESDDDSEYIKVRQNY